MGVMKQNRDVSRTQNLEFHQLYWRFMEKLLIVVGFGWKLDLDVLWSSGVIAPSGPPTRYSKKNGSIEPYEWRDPAMGGGKLSLQHNDPAMGPWGVVKYRPPNPARMILSFVMLVGGHDLNISKHENSENGIKLVCKWASRNCRLHGSKWPRLVS